MDLRERVGATGLLEEGRPVVVLLSGGRDSVCLLDVAATLAGPDAVRALHVNYGLRARGRRRRGPLPRRCARALGVALDVHRAPPARRRAGQPAGVGARRPLRRGRAAGGRGRAGGAASPRRTPPPTRPRRSSTGSRRRPVAGRCSAWRPRPGGSCARCSGSRARRPRRGAARAASRGARTRRTRATATRAGACAATWSRRCAPSTRRPSATSCAPPSCCATRPRCSTRSSTRRSPDATTSRSRTSRRCRRRSRGSWSAAWPRRPTGGLCARGARPPRRHPRAGRRARSTSATARAPSSPTASLRCERTPPLPARRT